MRELNWHRYSHHASNARVTTLRTTLRPISESLCGFLRFQDDETGPGALLPRILPQGYTFAPGHISSDPSSRSSFQQLKYFWSPVLVMHDGSLRLAWPVFRGTFFPQDQDGQQVDRYVNFQLDDNTFGIQWAFEHADRVQKFMLHVSTRKLLLWCSPDVDSRSPDSSG